MNVILKLFYELRTTTCKCSRWLIVLPILLVLCSVSIGAVVRALSNWWLRLPKHWQPWRSNWLLSNFSFTAILNLIALSADTISFSGVCFFILAWLALPFFSVWNLIHLFLLFFQIALLLFGKERFVSDDGNIDAILCCLRFLWEHVVIVVIYVILCACASPWILHSRCMVSISSCWLLISFLEIVAK